MWTFTYLGSYFEIFFTATLTVRGGGAQCERWHRQKGGKDRRAHPEVLWASVKLLWGSMLLPCSCLTATDREDCPHTHTHTLIMTTGWSTVQWAKSRIIAGNGGSVLFSWWRKRAATRQQPAQTHFHCGLVRIVLFLVVRRWVKMNQKHDTKVSLSPPGGWLQYWP